MNQLIRRTREPSTWAGFGLISQSLAALLATNGADANAWAGLLAGVAAVCVPEGQGAK